LLLCFLTHAECSSSVVVQGCYAGNAVGFRLTSLTKLVDTRSNKPRLTLLHFLVDEVCRQNHDAIEFVDALSQPLSVAARYDPQHSDARFIQFSKIPQQ